MTKTKKNVGISTNCIHTEGGRGAVGFRRFCVEIPVGQNVDDFLLLLWYYNLIYAFWQFLGVGVGPI